MGPAGVDVLPVVSRANLHQLEGVIVLRDILEAYGVGTLTPIPRPRERGLKVG